MDKYLEKINGNKNLNLGLWEGEEINNQENQVELNDDDEDEEVEEIEV